MINDFQQSDQSFGFGKSVKVDLTISLTQNRDFVDKNFNKTTLSLRLPNMSKTELKWFITPAVCK